MHEASNFEIDDRCRSELIPLRFSRRGGCASTKNFPFLSGADGVVSKRSRSLLINIRVAHLIFVGKEHDSATEFVNAKIREIPNV